MKHSGLATTVTPLTTAQGCGFALHGIESLGGASGEFGSNQPWYEALIRPVMDHFQGSPGEFIDQLYANRPSWEVDFAIFDRLTSWLGSQEEPTRVSINIHPETLTNHNFLEAVLERTQKASLDNHSVCLELVEFGACADRATLAINANRLREAGILIALDDFGSRLNCFDLCAAGIVDIIKIDISIVNGLEADTHQQAVVRGIVELASGLGAAVVAEGIESDAQLQSLQSLGVGYGQGYFFHKPRLVEDI